MSAIAPEILEAVSGALQEDVGAGDVTTNLLVPAAHRSVAQIVVKERAIVCGLEIAKDIFRRLDRNVQFQSSFKDGNKIDGGSRVLRIEGKTRAILTGERVALNFLSFCSGIATQTEEFVGRTRKFKTAILDTRKTTPGLRSLERYAVRCGGGVNHRFNLNDCLMIKDNHRVVCQTRETLAQTITRLKSQTRKPLIVEVDTLAQLKEVLEATPDVILLDNMGIVTIKKAVQLRKARGLRIPLEISGGINLKNIAAFARTGVERISIGALTHTRKNIDYSLEILKAK